MFGRFATRDLWLGDIREPTTLHKWLYAAANPTNRIDPSGFDPNCPALTPAYCARERLEEIIEGASGDSFEALFRTFEDRELTKRWWWSAGRTSGERLAWLRDVTSSGVKGSGIAPAHFAVSFGNSQCSLNPLFRDQAFYDNVWLIRFDNEQQVSRQVGHFLTAVHAAKLGRTGRRFTIGHEQVDDLEDVKLHVHIWNQYWSVTSTDIDFWEQAIEADEARQPDLRDELLWQILSFDEKIEFGGVDISRVGNSLQDLRLSLKGFRFWNWITENSSSHPNLAGAWLRNNLGIR